MKGADNREIMSINSPSCKAWKSNKTFPYEVDKEPYLTFIARQYGNAWDAPFVSIYEPFTSTEGKSIKSIKGFDDQNGDKSFAGVELEHNSGRKDFVLSSYDLKMAKYKNIESNAAYTMIGVKSKSDYEIFMGNGTSVTYGKTKIDAEKCGNAVLTVESGVVVLYNEVPVTVTINGKSRKYKAGVHSVKGL